MSSLVRQNEATESLTKRDMSSHAEDVAHEDDLMMRLVNQSVNRIWSDYDKSSDGYLTLEDSR